MSVIERWAIKVCSDCGAQVFGGGLCRQHHPPGHPVETMVARVSDLVVLRQQLQGAVETLRAIAGADVDLIAGKPQEPSGEYCVSLAKRALARLGGQ